MSDFVIVAVAALVVGVLAMGVTALVARRVGRISVVDATWGLALTTVALFSAVLGDGLLARRVLVLVLVAVWGVRLSSHIIRRSHGGDEDPRYVALLAGGASRLRKVWVPQGAAIWLVSLPVQAAALQHAKLGVLDVAGLLVWILGVAFESIGDAQLRAYKSLAERPPVLDRGLWAWTRHPNYFGDACVWWGIWLIALHTPWALLTVVAPITMTWFLYSVTGAKLLEKTMMKRPGYPEYAARTSMFFPRPPRAGA